MTVCHVRRAAKRMPIMHARTHRPSCHCQRAASGRGGDRAGKRVGIPRGENCQTCACDTSVKEREKVRETSLRGPNSKWRW